MVNGADKIDWSRLDGTLEFIDKQYDCSDFRMVSLLRILCEYEDIPDMILLMQKRRRMIKRSPKDLMENHCISILKI